jgi:FKBP-type peptidyl-prolyl cis-trans isomerase
LFVFSHFFFFFNDTATTEIYTTVYSLSLHDALPIYTDASYAMGMFFASSLKNDGLIPDADEFIQGMTEALNGDELRYSIEEATSVLQESLEAFLAQLNAESGNPPSAMNLSNDASYAMGMIIGSRFMGDNLSLNVEEFAVAMKAVFDGTETRYTPEEADRISQQAFAELQAQDDAKKMQAEIDFLAENSKKPGIVITNSGLQYEVLTEGTGAKPVATDTVVVHYVGTFTDGKVFDSSRAKGEPATFPLAGVIPGWTEGIPLMNVGSTFRFFIPSSIGYGPQGAPPVIPAYSTLIFEVELIDIVQGE